MTINRVAQAGFSKGAAAYERGRPDYPASAIAFMTNQLGLSNRATVLDIGAGTGKLARLLLETGAQVIAIEPVAAMRDQFARILPATKVLGGAAEALPLGDHAADAATAAQAFHWFANAQALAEIHRVLKPHGRLGLIWNSRDRSAGWARDVWALVERDESNLPRYHRGDWKCIFTEYAGFRPVTERSFAHSQRGDFSMVVDRISSLSFVAAMEEAERAKLVSGVHALLQRHAETRGQKTIEIRYTTDVYIYESI